MTRRLVCSLALASLAAVPAAAQNTISVSGLLRPVNGPSICNQRFSHEFECSRVRLYGASVRLQPFEGQVVTVQGVDLGVTCRVIHVSSIQPAAGTLDWRGNATPGGTVSLTMTGPGISENLLFLGSGRAFFPLDLRTGTLLLAPPFWLLGGGFSGSGIETLSFQIPRDPRLIGYDAVFQSLHRTVGPIGPYFFGNAVCIEVR